MNPLKATMQQAAVGMQVQTQRIGLTSENISNADTPGYRRKVLVPDTDAAAATRFNPGDVILDESPGERSYKPGHPMADADGYITGSNVSLVIEMADMRDANRTYEANLNAFQQARRMYGSLLDILRR